MKDRVVLCALCALLGCKQATVPETEPIALYYSTTEASKTDILTQGDQIGVFASIEGTENFFIEHIKYVVGSDGRSLSTSPAVYYPEAKQAVAFYAYSPYHTGVFSVPNDQSTTLKQADLCWAKASSTPVAAPVPLEFNHKMARLLITTNEPTSKIVVPNVFSGGTLDIKTGTFTNTLKSTISTTGNELILPAQTLSRLVLTVSGVEYIYDGSILLETAKTTTANFTLNPATKTATLSGSSTTNWISSANQGNPTQAVSNILTMHWPNYLPQGATPDKVVLTINNTDYTISNGITYADKTFTVPFASAALRYPYTITKIAFNKIPLACTQLLGATIYKSGASTLGIKDVPNAILINGLWWATGDLIASNAEAGERGLGGCKVGAPMDGGLYFQFGSLIGWKGGNQDNGGTGVGMPKDPLVSTNGKFWNGVGFSWKSDAMVWPTGMVGAPSAWPSDATNNQWYFGLQTGWSNPNQDIRDFPNLTTGGLANVGVGDACSYYLGSLWRLPTITELSAITAKKGNEWVFWATDGLTGRWATAAQTFGGVSGPGAWFGAGLNANTGTPSPLVNPFFSASGHREYSNGSFVSITRDAYRRSSSIASATEGHYLIVREETGVIPQRINSRSYGFPVRCVSDAP